MLENDTADIQDLDKLLRNIMNLKKRLKKYTYCKRNLQKQDSVLRKYIITEEKAHNILAVLSKRRASFSTLEVLRVRCEECEKFVEEFENSLDEEQFERYKDIKRSNFLQDSCQEMSSTVSSSSIPSSASVFYRSSSLRTQSINQSIKLDQMTNKRCACLP